MKDSVLRMIEAWQQNPNRTRGLCLRNPTCSVYGHRAISRYGLIRGGIMTAWRVFTCNGCMRQRHRWPGDAYRSDVPTLSGTRSP
jgi:hypothetical protein